MIVGDCFDVFVVMNLVVLKVNIGDLLFGGMVIVNFDEFIKCNLMKVGYVINLLEFGELFDYVVYIVVMIILILGVVEVIGVFKKDG